MPQLTKNFTLEELQASETARTHGIDNKIPKELMPNAQRLAEFLQQLRDTLDAPIMISSGYRCRELNRIVGGSGTSAHEKALAADIRVKGYTPEQLFQKIRSLSLDYDQVIQEFDRWVHVGLADKPRKQDLRATTQNGKTVYNLV